MCQVNAKTQPASSPQHHAWDPTYQAPNMPVSSRGSGAGVVIHEVSVPPRRIWAGLGWAGPPVSWKEVTVEEKMCLSPALPAKLLLGAH